MKVLYAGAAQRAAALASGSVVMAQGPVQQPEQRDLRVLSARVVTIAAVG